MSKGWITDRRPTVADTRHEIGDYVEVTTKDGRIAWKEVYGFEWENVTAWRRIRKQYKGKGSGKMSKGWITDRFPTEDDVREESGFCVEVTYENGLMGWSRPDEFSEDYPEGQKILAWRKIRKPYKGKK